MAGYKGNEIFMQTLQMNISKGLYDAGLKGSFYSIMREVSGEFWVIDFYVHGKKHRISIERGLAVIEFKDNTKIRIERTYLLRFLIALIKGEKRYIKKYQQ